MTAQQIFAEYHANFIKRHRPDALRDAHDFERDLHVLLQASSAATMQPFMEELAAFRSTVLSSTLNLK